MFIINNNVELVIPKEEKIVYFNENIDYEFLCIYYHPNIDIAYFEKNCKITQFIFDKLPKSIKILKLPIIDTIDLKKFINLEKVYKYKNTIIRGLSNLEVKIEILK